MQTFIVDPILPPQSADNEWIKYIGNNLKRQQIVCCTEGKNFVSVLIKARKKTVNLNKFSLKKNIIPDGIVSPIPKSQHILLKTFAAAEVLL